MSEFSHVWHCLSQIGDLVLKSLWCACLTKHRSTAWRLFGCQGLPDAGCALQSERREITLFCLKCFLENEIFLDKLKFFGLDFLRKWFHFLRNCNLVFFASEVDSESLSRLRKIICKREASSVEGYVTPSCTEMRLSVRNLRKSVKVCELSKKIS